MDRSARMGERLRKELSSIVDEFDVLDGLGGKGLYFGFEIVKNKRTRVPDPDLGGRIANLAFKNGLLINVSKMRMKEGVRGTICPPLVVTEEEMDKGLEILRSTIKQSI